MRYRTDTERLSDAKLVERLQELLSARVALETALTSALSEYQSRRVKIVRAGKTIGPPLNEPLAVGDHVRASMARREGVAKQHAECDAMAQRDPRTRSLLAS